MILVGFLVLTHWNTSTYSITPGDAQNVAPLVSVSGLSTDPHQDQVLLTDVYLKQLTAWGWILAHFQPHTEMVNESDLVPSGVPVNQIVDQGYVDMSVSKDNAQAAALRSLGWTIPAHAAGATIYAVGQSTPASHAGLQVADRVVGIDGQVIHTACDMIRATHPDTPGSKVILSVERATISSSGTITLGAAHNVTVVTAPTPDGQASPNCAGVSGPPKSVVGVVPTDAVTYNFPGTITITTPNIGGPSAGLAMTLTLVDRLSSGSLTGHNVIAATGTMDPTGAVGDVGGVAEKTIAVENAGASVFIVPQSEVSTASGASNGHLRVIGVRTLSQALAALRRLGGAPPIPLTKPYPVKPTT